MEDKLPLEANEPTPARRRATRGEFLTDWLSLRKTEADEASAPKQEVVASQTTELNYLAHDKEPPAKEIEAPDNLVVGSTARYSGELQRQRQEEDSLRQQLDVAPNLETERQEIIERQTAFGQELATDSEPDAREAQPLKLESNPQQPTEQLVNQHEVLKEEGIKQFARTSPEAKPGDILVNSQEAADRNIPVEGMRELQHEHKDEADVTSTTDEVNYYPSEQVVPSPSPDQYADSGITGSTKTDQEMFRTSQSGSNLYRQAMVAGFWTALILIIIVLSIIIVRR